MDIWPLLQSAGAAAVGGIGSLLAALHSTEKKYDDLQGKLKSLGEDSVRISAVLTWKQSLENELRNKTEALVSEKFDTLRRGFRMELDNFKDDVERKIPDMDRQPTRPDLVTLEELRRRCDQLEGKLDRMREEHAEYVTEQGRQWNEMNRTLGQIMGEVKTRPYSIPR